jgi:hypothetical protein
MLVISLFSFSNAYALIIRWLYGQLWPAGTWKWYLYQYVYSIHLDGCKGQNVV